MDDSVNCHQSVRTRARAEAAQTCVELEAILEKRVAEPNSSECVQQSLVKVICHSAAILDFSNHVTDLQAIVRYGSTTDTDTTA